MDARYSSASIFSSKIKCSECGNWYGSKVWHSQDKYRRVIFQCNHKFKNDKKCWTPHLHIILRDFPLVLLPLLREEVRRVLLLQERVPFVLLVGEDALYGTLVPVVLPRGAFDAESRQLLSDGIRA